MSSSFLQRLKKKDVIPSTPEDQKQEKVDTQIKQSAPPETATADQLRVDIYKTPGAIVVYAQIAGASIHDYGVLIEGDGDVITIKGQRNRPNGDSFEDHSTEGKEKVIEECSWGPFYRQIILPAEVDPSKTQAKMREGVLMLLLPLKETKETGVRIQVVQV